MTNRLKPVRLVIAIGSAVDAASRRTVESTRLADRARVSALCLCVSVV